jgi:hypothetical protein
VRRFHRVEGAVKKAEGDLLVEEIAHRIDKDHLRFAPPKRLFQSFGAKLEVKTVLEWMPRYSPKPF